MAILDFEGLQYFFSGLKSIFAAKSHTHDERYYTESEMDGKLAGKSNTGHTHDLSAMINTLTTGGSVPVDADFYISQYVGGGTTTTSYHRRPMSALWSYIKRKADSVYQPKGSYAAANHTHAYLPLSGGTMSGQIKRNTGCSWINDRDSAIVYGPSSGTDSGYHPVVGQKTPSGAWTIGTYGDERLIFDYTKDTDKKAGTNNAIQVYLPAQAGTIITSATIGAQTVDTAKKVADSNNSKATTFAYSKSGMNYTDYTWLAAWNGYELRAVNKSQFATAGHTHGLNSNSMAMTVDNAATNSWNMIGGNSGFLLRSLRMQASAPTWLEKNYAAGIAFGGSDTKGVISTAYNAPCIKIAGGNGNAPVWWLRLTGTSGKEYNLNSMPYAQSAGSVAWNNVSGKPDLYTKAQVDQLLKKAMYSEGKLVGTGKVTYSYLEDGILVVPSTSDYIKIVSVSDNTTYHSYTIPLNTKIVIGSTIYTQNGNKDGEITFDTNGKITCVGYCQSPKNGTCTYYIEAYQYY